MSAPWNGPGQTGDDWLEALDRAGRVGPPAAREGLLADMAELNGPTFSAGDLHAAVRDFYQRTASYRLEVWSQWSAAFAPGGELIARLFGRRVQQLALPVQPLATSRGMTSTVRVVTTRDGRREGAAWLRTLRSDGSAVYSGFYQVGRLPGVRQPVVKVSFPLEEGSVQVFLTPTVDPADGSLWLSSRSSRFGEDGTYVVVRVGRGWHAAQVKLRETFHVFVDAEGTLRTDHTLRVARWEALRLHYRLETQVAGVRTSSQAG